MKFKVCMVGEFSVGKTSLVSQFVNSIFSETYLTTVGVKIDKKSVSVGNITSDLIIWDIAGGSDSRGMLDTYIRGAHGFLYVIDGTRPSTLDLVEQVISERSAPTPAIVVINKVDLKESWKLSDADLKRIHSWNIPTLETSAKLGSNVEESFTELTRKMVSKNA
jgi:small GTP-binding protein